MPENDTSRTRAMTAKGPEGNLLVNKLNTAKFGVAKGF